MTPMYYFNLPREIAEVLAKAEMTHNGGNKITYTFTQEQISTLPDGVVAVVTFELQHPRVNVRKQGLETMDITAIPNYVGA